MAAEAWAQEAWAAREQVPWNLPDYSVYDKDPEQAEPTTSTDFTPGEWLLDVLRPLAQQLLSCRESGSMKPQIVDSRLHLHSVPKLAIDRRLRGWWKHWYVDSSIYESGLIKFNFARE